MEKVTIEGINMKKKHIKPKGDVKGTTISKEFPIHVSNVKKEE
jgi:ribosomal protein L24